jgi:hypothetical protein
LNQRVHVDGKTVPNTSDFDVLIKRIVVAVLGQQANVAFTVGNLILASRVIGDIGVRNVLNVANDAVVDLGNVNIGLIVNRNHLDTWAIHALLVGDLFNVLRQLVDGQTRARIDRLTLHSTASLEHISGPLPLIVR